MTDPRAIIAGILAAIALVGAILLSVLERDAAQAAAVLGVASTFGGYVVGLYSEPRA
jgi:hypothetical protein